VFTGDLVFVAGTPIAWPGPISNWITACDTICGLDVEIVVPGPGPVTDKQGVLDVKRYFEFVFAGHSSASVAARRSKRAAICRGRDEPITPRSRGSTSQPS
jgi:hypothetical protein